MKHVIVLGALLLLSGCAHTAAVVNCDNAQNIKTLALATIEAINKACPIVADDAQQNPSE
jgi:hypothetical protein